MSDGKSMKKNKIARDPELGARFLVVEAIRDRSAKTFPTQHIWTLANRYHVPARQRPFAYDLLTGVIKRKRILDCLVEKFSGRRIRQIDSAVLAILHLGIYQILFEDGVPDFAAVNTICELTRHLIGKKPVGFVNVILRNLLRGIADRDVAVTGENVRRVVPVGLGRGVEFREEIFAGDLTEAALLAVAYSYPTWLVKRWLEYWDAKKLTAILAAGNARPATTLRPNLLRTDAGKLKTILEDEACEVCECGDGESLMLIDNPRMRELQAFTDGLFQVQDETAGDVARNIDLLKAEGEVERGRKIRVLDLCAGLGTKTTQVAELTGDAAEIFATDSAESKLELLRENAKRLGIESIVTISLGELESEKYRNYFDVVLLDVPCTNTGVFDRRPEARWRLKGEDFDRYTELSFELLVTAERLVTSEGQIAFSTCSLDRYEDKQALARFTSEFVWSIRNEKYLFPVFDADLNRTIRTGGYWALLEHD